MSYDEGKTWPQQYRRVISNLKGNDTKAVEIGVCAKEHILTKTNGQKEGYMVATQTPDGIIYLTDGKIVYSFNGFYLNKLQYYRYLAIIFMFL